MQYNKDAPTIEGALRDALVAAGGISASNADAFAKVGWSRAARTDKGVSAVGQVVALRLLHPVADMTAAVNAHLPDGIRVLGAARVTAGFDARKSCDRRRYEYILPAHAFDPGACRAKADKGKKEGKGGEAAAKGGEAAAK
jgi:tRNA pseudouridine38-40 synthase